MTQTRPAAVVVLAAGGGTRMKSATPKVLHGIGGRTLLGHALAAARGADPEQVVVVVRHDRDRVADHALSLDAGVLIADQDDVAGTGRATECGLAVLASDLQGTVVVTGADAPLLTAETLTGIAASHRESGAHVTVLTAQLADPTGYGRIVRGPSGDVLAIVEERDATAEQRAITEVNSGLYAFDAATLRDGLSRIGDDNAQGEKYLTDVLAVVHARGGRISTYAVADAWQLEGVNDRRQLARLGAELNRRVVARWMLDGVTVIDPETTWIDLDVRLGRDVTLHPHTQLLGATTVADDAVVGPDSTLTDTEVGAGAQVVRTQAALSVIGAGASVGPFAHLRPGSEIGPGGKVGEFVGVKNSTIGAGAKVPHLSYVGDAEIGEGTNLGAGTIVANYDGAAKHRTSIGAHCRTGANNTFVAPVTVGDGSATGAGTVVRHDVPPGALALSAGPQRLVLDWVRRRWPGSAQAAAAERAGVETPGAETPEEETR